MKSHKRAIGDPWETRWRAIKLAAAALERGETLRVAATAAGVHVATLCRWRLLSPQTAHRLKVALDHSRVLRECRASIRRFVRAWAPWRRDCPHCGTALEVRTRRGGGRFLAVQALA